MLYEYSLFTDAYYLVWLTTAFTFNYVLVYIWQSKLNMAVVCPNGALSFRGEMHGLKLSCLDVYTDARSPGPLDRDNTDLERAFL